MKVNVADLANLISDDMQIFYEWINSELNEKIANEFDGSVSFFNTGLNLACTVRDNLMYYAENSNYSKVYELNAFLEILMMKNAQRLWMNLILNFILMWLLGIL